jgi:hypothetical protein
LEDGGCPWETAVVAWETGVLAWETGVLAGKKGMAVQFSRQVI